MENDSDIGFEIITVTISNNLDYINENDPESIEYLEEDEEKIFPIYPFELELSISEFKTLWCGLGLHIDLEEDYNHLFGELNPTKLLNHIDNAWIELCIKEGTKKIENGKEFIVEGISKEKAKILLFCLREIALEAIERSEIIIWE